MKMAVYATVSLAAAAAVMTGCSDSEVKSDSSVTSVVTSSTLAAPVEPVIDAANCAQPSVEPVEWKAFRLPGGQQRPTLRVPVMAGWVLDSSNAGTGSSVKATLSNPSLARDGVTPTLVVAVSTADSDFNDYVQGLQAADGVSGFNSTPTSVCGLDARRVSYTKATAGQAPLATTAAMVNVPNDTGGLFVGVFSQTTDPANPTYQADSAAVLDNIQVV